MRSLSSIAVTLAICLLATTAGAEPLGKGKSVVWVGVNGNTAQLLGTGLVLPFEAGEIGVHLALSHFLSDAWTVVLSGGYDASNTTIEPAGAGKDKFTSSSYNLRIGGDRYAFINQDVALYAGPGLIYWKGHAKFEPAVGSSDTGPDVTQIGLNGRIGMYARLAGHAALFGHIGQVLATNSGEDSFGKFTWWSNQHEGSVGLAFDF